MQQVIKSENIVDSLTKELKKQTYDRLFVLTDEHTDTHCYPLIALIPQINKAERVVIPAEDSNKSIENLAYIWKFLTSNGATRNSLLINLGGGMVTDIGGFAAATFKRGINYINIPTSLLSMVDASVGGKTGINFEGYKNEIGAFYPAQFVFISTEFLKSLSKREILSGYAEMIKHGLLQSKEEWDRVCNFNLDNIDYSLLNDLVIESVSIKQGIVEKDPYENNIRKALNLGHTIGHAIESYALDKNNPVPHGFAVAWGLIAELYLSHKLCDFPLSTLESVNEYISSNFGTFKVSQEEYKTLYDFMIHDKKNVGNTINFTLLADIGDIQINRVADKEVIYESLAYLCNV